MMSRLQKGMVAGFAATVVVSVMEAVNLVMGPWFGSFPGIIAFMLGMPGNLAVGWPLHFVMGTLVLGSIFGLIASRLPTDTSGTKGIVFAVGAFVVMMTGIFLFGDFRMFRGTDGFGTIAWLLVTHAVFGITLGTVYGQLMRREKRMLRDMGGAAPAH